MKSIIDFILKFLSKMILCTSTAFIMFSILLIIISAIILPNRNKTRKERLDFFERFFDNIKEFMEKEKARKEEQDNIE